MKKIVLVVCVALSVLLCLGGCGGKSGDKASNGKKVITIWSSDSHDMDIRMAQVKKFNEENKDNIEIVYEVKTEGIMDKLKLSYLSNEAPDIHSHLSGDLMKSAVEGGWLRELPKENVEKYKKEFVDGSIRYYPGNQKAYSVGVSMNTYKMIWNKELFKECGLDPERPPKTWDEVAEYAKIITQKGKGIKYGFALPFKEDWIVSLYVNNPSAPTGNFTINGFDPKTNKYDFTVFKPVIKALLRLKEDGSLFPTCDSLNNDTARAQFAEGNVGMMFAATYDIGVYNEQFPAKIDFGVTDYPTFGGKVAENGGYVFDLAGSAYQMNASSKYPEEQLKVFEWLISEDVIKELSLAGKGVYSHVSVFNKPEFLPKNKKGGVELSTFTSPYYTFPDLLPNQLVKIEGDGFSKVISNIINYDSSDIDGKLKDLNKRYNAGYKKLADSGMDISVFHDPNFGPKYDAEK